MERVKRLKVVYVCHFSNEMVRRRLRLKTYGLCNILLKYIGRRSIIYEDFAPWVTNILYQSHIYNNIETHVISPHKGMKEGLEEFEDEGVYYHLFRSFPSSLIHVLDNRLFNGNLVSYKRNRKMVEKLIRKISPDLIVLIGTENPYYSSTVLNINDIPIYILCQTVYNNPEMDCSNNNATHHKRVAIERMLLNKTNYCGVYCDMHKDMLIRNGYSGFIFDFYWPSGKPFVAEPRMCQKYDFVNFANGMSQNKGYHDCLKALVIVKQKYPNIQLALVDKGPESVKKELIEIIEKNNLSQNVTFIPFFEKKTDLLQFLHSVRFAVLPCKTDYISGTMHQAMGQGLPLVVYETPGTPLLNAHRQCVLIAKKNDIKELAEKMTDLMDDDGLASMLSRNSLWYMSEYRKANEYRMKQLVEVFYSIVDHYNNGTSIPDNMLL